MTRLFDKVDEWFDKAISWWSRLIDRYEGIDD